jgi:preprotein translocase subunit SecF
MAQWIKPDIDFDFMGRARLFVGMSWVAVLLSLLLLVVNLIWRGEILNYGNDFRGGSEIQVEFKSQVSPARVRAALEKHGYAGAEVVSITDPARPYFYLVRLSEVSAYSKEQVDKARVALKERFRDEGLKRLDFSEGGDKIYVRFGKDVDENNLQEAFRTAGITSQHVERFGRPEDHGYQITVVGLDREMRRAFDAGLGEGSVKDIPQIESVGAKVGKQLRTAGVRSVLYTLILILLYVALRFDFEFAPGAVIALAHDVIIITGLFALLWKEFTLQTVAALLTIGGYSVMDTIVVFDRIRENLTRLRERRLRELVNASINETLSRTILTSLITLFTTSAVWYFTRGPVRDFGLAMTFGVAVGTYSSVFVAAPMYLWLHDRVARRAKPV